MTDPPPTARARDAVVRVAVPAADTELAADALWQAGAAAIEERPGVLIAAPRDADDVAALGRLEAAVAARWPAEVVAVDLDAALDAWREHAGPVVVADRLVVRPPWVGDAGRQDAADVVEVVIDPGRAFGSGAHASTRLALAALVDLVRPGTRVLDVGCGSGVLAIAALALGAASAVGVDLDAAAVAATTANAARNGVGDRLTVAADLADALGGAAGGPRPGTAGSPRPFDLVVANLLLPDLLAVAPLIARAAATAPGPGVVVVSGVLARQRAAALAPFAEADFDLVSEAREGEWLAVTLRAAPAAPPPPPP